jgi:competence protein ComEC
MPWYDRTIDVILATHPDADHIGGLPDVLARYKVGLVVESSVQDAGGVDAQAFAKAIQEEKAQHLVAERGQVIDLGEGVWLEILFPDRDVASIETNTGSVVARLVYGETAFMLTGDSPKAIEDYLVQIDGEALDSDVLKAGHHGSRTSSSLSFVGFVSPEYAIYSRGCDNTYGHPHDEVKETFARLGVTTVDTCEEGNITFISDGKTVVRR